MLDSLKDIKELNMLDKTKHKTETEQHMSSQIGMPQKGIQHYRDCGSLAH